MGIKYIKPLVSLGKKVKSIDCPYFLINFIVKCNAIIEKSIKHKHIV